MPEQSLEQSLEQYFGFSNFRGNQKEIVSAIIDGHDVLTLMSTGGGKSLCFQLPAVLLSGMTVVISPLISLMQDQVEHLLKNNILATWITHLLPPDETAYRLELVTINHYRLLYVSPERLQDDNFCAVLRAIPISMVVVDEAHCISEWGHEFRPEYRQISLFLNWFPSRPIVAAFTATATPAVAKDIVTQLQLRDPSIFHTSVKRSNLALHVIACHKQQEKWLHLLRILREHNGENGIIYATIREAAQCLAIKLQQLAKQVTLFNWLHVGFYHAGLTDNERHICQLNFQSGKHNVLCATTAFGMGIDKSDIRFVIHTEHPNCLESYFQQVGRAGRDGLNSAAYLLFHPLDFTVHLQMIHSQQQLLTKKMNIKRLQAMVLYCKNKSCRMQQITKHFGETTQPCQMCDYCRGSSNLHRFFQSPLSSRELDTIQQLRAELLRSNFEHLVPWTEFQLLTALSLQPSELLTWRYIPGCGRGWRINYEHYRQNTHTRSNN